MKPCNFIERRLQHRCFPVNIAKFLRIFFLKNSSVGFIKSEKFAVTFVVFFRAASFFTDQDDWPATMGLVTISPLSKISWFAYFQLETRESIKQQSTNYISRPTAHSPLKWSKIRIRPMMNVVTHSNIVTWWI